MSEEEESVLGVIRRLIEEAEEQFKGLPGLTDPAELDDEPLWAQCVYAEVVKTVLPAVDFNKGGLETAETAGAILGHKLAEYQMFCEASLPGVIPKLLGARGSEIGPQECGRLAEAIDQMVFTISTCVGLATFLPRDEGRKFFKSFQKGLERGPADMQHSNMQRTNTEIYMLLWVTRDAVKKLRSVSELHRGLVHVLGPARAGDLKRLEKICQRIGLRFGPPGRPKAIQEIQTSGDRPRRYSAEKSRAIRSACSKSMRGKNSENSR